MAVLAPIDNHPGCGRIAEQVDPAYLVIGSRKRTAVGTVLLRSVSQLVLSNADVPVVTVEQAT